MSVITSLGANDSGSTSRTTINTNFSNLNADMAPLASPTFTGTVTVPVALTGVLRADSGVVSVDSDVTDIVSAASSTTAGKIEIATAAEVTTGSDATRSVSPDSLAESSIFGVKEVSCQVIAYATNVTTGDGKFYYVVPSSLNGMNLVGVHGRAITAGTTGTMDVQIANVTDTVDMLSTKLTWDSTEAGTNTAATPVVIDTTKDDVATNDLLRIDVDAAQTTPAQGMIITLTFSLP